MDVRSVTIGAAFVFCQDGAVYVRCARGFRLVRGGERYTLAGHPPVFAFTGVTGIWQLASVV